MAGFLPSNFLVMDSRRADALAKRSQTARGTAPPELVSDLHPSRHLAAAAVPRLQALTRSLAHLPHRLRLLDEAGGEIFACGRRLGLQEPSLLHTVDIRSAGSVAHAPARVGTLQIRVSRDQEPRLIRALAAQAAYAIERDLNTHQALRHTELLHAMELVADAALSHVQIDALLHDVLLRLREMFQVDTAAILLVNESGQQLEVTAAAGGPLKPAVGLSGEKQEVADGVVVPMGQGIVGRIAADGNPVVIDDLSQVEDGGPLKPGFGLSGVEPGAEAIASLMGAPLAVEEQVIGVLLVGTIRPRRFNASELKQLQIMADRLALAVEHVRLTRAERSARSAADRAERRFRDLVQSLNAIIWEADARTLRFTFVSRRAERMLGYPARRWLKDEDFWAVLVHPDDRELVMAKIRKAMEQGRSSVFLEYRVNAADGRTLWIRSLFDVLRHHDGAPQQLRGLMLDVTDRRLAEEAALRLAAIVESSEEAIIGKNLDGIITSWNAGAESMYGYTAAEVVGRHISLLSPPQRLAEIEEFMRKLRAGERITHYETRRVRKDGEVIDVALTLSPIRNPEGAVIGASTIARDITEMKRAERTLRQTEKLAATGRLAASIAHEINNPMASVTNLLYLLEHHDSIDDTAREYVRLAEEELSRVTHIVRQMLGFYREAAAPVAVSLKDVLENILMLYGRRISNARVEVHRRYEFEGAIRAFPGEMRQVFSNLIINAVEAMNKGGSIHVRVRRACDWTRSGAAGVRVLIADTGPGITPEARRRIFEPFFTTKGERGTGLGLWVSEGIVRKHGGFIHLRSSRDARRHGTCFSVFLPLVPLARRDAEDAAERVA